MRRTVCCSALLLFATGCFPDIPPCDDGCALDDTGGTSSGPGSSTDAGPGSTDGPGSSGGPGPSDSSSSGGSDESDSSSGTDTGNPPLEGCDAPFSPLSYVGKTVSSAWFSLTFDGEDNANAPGELTLECGSTENVMFRDPSTTERRFGVAHWPDWNNLAGATTVAAPDVLEDGPVVVRLRFDWDIGDYDGNMASDATGSSVFTIAADGRILRQDEVHIHDETMMSGKWLVGYSALDAAKFTHVDVSGDATVTGYVLGSGMLAPPDTIAQGDVSETLYACARNASEPGDALGWVAISRGDVGTEVWTGQRVTDVQFGGAPTHAAVFQHDFVRGGTPPAGVYHAASMLVVDVATPEDCATALTTAAAYATQQDPVVMGQGTLDDVVLNRLDSSAYPILLTGPGMTDLVVPTIAMDTILVTLRDDSGAALELESVKVDGRPLDSSEYIVQDSIDATLPDTRWLLVSGFSEGAMLTVTHVAG